MDSSASGQASKVVRNEKAMVSVGSLLVGGMCVMKWGLLMGCGVEFVGDVFCLYSAGEEKVELVMTE